MRSAYKESILARILISLFGLRSFDPQDLTGDERAECAQRGGHQMLQVRKPIGRSAQSQLRESRRLAIVSWKQKPQLLINTLINQDFHRCKLRSDSRQSKFFALL
jgi:hypothetical protein